MKQTSALVRGAALLAVSSVPVFALISCGGDDGVDPVAATQDAKVKYAWTEVGPNAQVLVRAVTADTACPKIMVDGTLGTMNLRAAPGTAALRPTASDPADSKPSVFDVTSCETALPASAQNVYAAGRQLPVPKAEPNRIVLLADTGCRLKKADNAFQACTDGTAWPFATIAATAAAMKPDLVIHMGDYHYRENACPADLAGCKDSPWGYGWDTWEADLFKPGAPLLAAAPWVLVRGNHEECARAGQGWARFLDTSAYSASRSCDLTANDNTGNFTEPYAVALGAATQIVIFDSAKAGTAAFPATDFKFPIYQAQFKTVAALAAKPAVTTLFANHHPILAYAPLAGAAPIAGNAALLGVMNSLNATAYYPPGVKLAMHGHVHDFQAINYTSDHPATIVTGNGGDNVDVNLPDPFPMTVASPGTLLQSITHTNTFGFMVMDRTSTGWTYKAYTRDGKLLTTCTPNGSKIACDKTGFLAP
jgi:hypothetical protein